MVGVFEKQNRIKLMAIFIMIAIGIGVYFMMNPPTLVGHATGELGSDAQCSYDYSLKATDADGNIVDIPIESNVFQSAFSIGGEEVTAVNPGVSWIISGEGVVWSTLVVTVTIKVSVATGGGDDWSSNSGPDGFDYILEKTLVNSDSTLIAEYTEALVLGEDIAASSTYRINGEDIVSSTGDTYEGEGWYYKFEYSVVATVDDILGDPITETLDLGAFGVWIGWGATLTLRGDYIF